MEERMAALFEPTDALLSAQYWGTCTREGYLEPEKMLMLSVLEDGLACFQEHLQAGDTRFREAEEWIMDDNSDYLFSFETICETLGLDPKHVRQELLRWKENLLATFPRCHAATSRGIRKRKQPKLILGTASGTRRGNPVPLSACATGARRPSLRPVPWASPEHP
jgi:hypothetical protein